MGKRQRNDSPSWWTNVTEEVWSNGGFLHSSLEFSESNRELTATDKIEEGTLVMIIPDGSLVSKERAMILCPWLKEVESNLVSSTEFHTPLSDVFIALAMASESPITLSYLSTLPDPATFDALPRRWTDDQIEARLKGSPLSERVKKTKQGVRKDYNLVQTACNDLKEKPAAFPSFDEFSNMLAVVSSRAFCVGHSDQDVALVPILDLCDHCRGSEARKNLSYKRVENGSIEVRSIQSIEQDEGLRLTYGAQGNAQLLLNYGFSIPRNLEPDGSSNDVLEFSLLDGMPVIQLRTGPKSYAYGGLVKALEQVVDMTPDESRDQPKEDDMEAFLNGCDEEDEEVDIYGEATEGGSDKDDESCTIQRELVALKSFQVALQESMGAYNNAGINLTDRTAHPKPCANYYSALLIQSEQRTIHFFARAAEKIVALLQGKTVPQRSKELQVDLTTTKEDIELIEAQTEELAQAFMKIRYGDIL
jgi:hypothetical protein